MTKELNKPDYLFEVSWEVCNKVGGIYTVIATKSLFLKSQLNRHHILIGPDVWMDTDANPDFREDPLLWQDWRLEAAKSGLRLRIGKWNVPGNPVAILVDFKQFLTEQNWILGKYWEVFGVDSITGNWDYKESALFGYVSGKVIESFYNFYLSSSDKVVAQFHEWQTGAGVLYLKYRKLPVATVFTTHATVVGRCLAGNNLPLYDSMESYNPDDKARQFNVTALYSLEKKSAENADVFTTVSDITARECEHFLGRPVDVVTPNGFENSFTPSTDEEYVRMRADARGKLREVAAAMSCSEVPEDAILIGIGGRYEYRNKGIDVFIDAVSKVKNSGLRGKQIHAFIMIPSGHNGADRDLVAKLSGTGNADYRTQVSHYLMNPEYDQITRRFRELGLDNASDSDIKVYFIPSYLNGNDGVFNMKYYDLLIGLDLALFPSYYEPWGYTPLESLAFRVPTLTTTLAGFGLWVDTHYNKEHPGITVVERNDSNYQDVVDAVAERIREISLITDEQRKEYMDNAKDVSSIALWENQIQYYQEAYSMAIDKVIAANGAFPESVEKRIMTYEKLPTSTPSWKSVMVTRHLPDALKGLEVLSKNLWWCWNESAKALFKAIDPVIWHDSGHNPMAVLDTVSLKRFKTLSKDAAFMGQYESVMQEFNDYMALKAREKTLPSDISVWNTVWILRSASIQEVSVFSPATI